MVLYVDCVFDFSNCSSESIQKQDYIVRVEYQGRGTLHVHVCAWVSYCAVHVDPISGRNALHGRNWTDYTGPLVDFLNSFLECNIDVQRGGGLTEAMLHYVAGYASKQSDSLTFKKSEYDIKEGCIRKWLTTYRLMAKRSVSEPEMCVDLAGLTPMYQSFVSGYVYAPVPTPDMPRRVGGRAYDEP